MNQKIIQFSIVTLSIFAVIFLLSACGAGDPEWDAAIDDYEAEVQQLVEAVESGNTTQMAKIGRETEATLLRLNEAREQGSLSLGQIKRVLTVSADAAKAWASR
ncbi:MAG: hypothetical protein D6B26_06170 [Spirochaetaceae bacterium]|nr:MAG: hypothetical protein D6B26_06170 [Spirochaetaceae bacterium]